jgi:phospholipid/cholesterol/gamma-HCH transport system ATP-binding protein
VLDAPTPKEKNSVTIDIKGLKKSFGEKKVLDGVDLEIKKGESMVIIGASGTGKSVLIKHVIGLMLPDAGTVSVDGVRIAELSSFEANVFRRRFGMLFQGGALFDSMTVYDNIAFPLCERGGVPAKQIDERVREMLSLVEMTGWESHMPSDLSGGMKKRVGLARALVASPSIMLYDEPTTGLDPVVGGVIDRLIVRTRDRFSVTSITITHDMKSANRIADKIAMLFRGKVIAIGSPEEIRKDSLPEVREFVKDRTSMLSQSFKPHDFAGIEKKELPS